MSIFDLLKNNLYETHTPTHSQTFLTEDDSSIEGDSKALVDGMLENAPGQKEQIGYILKYAANSNPNYDIWDQAYDYYESIDTEETTEEEPVSSEEPLDEPSDETVSDEPAEPTDDEDMFANTEETTEEEPVSSEEPDTEETVEL